GGNGTMSPAISPDGKRIAVASLKGEPMQAKTIQLTLYGFDGKKLHQSKEFAWSPAKKDINRITSPAMLFWSPKDDMVVVSDNGETGIYNVKADTLKVL